MSLRYVASGQFSGAGLYDAYPPLVPLLMAFPHLAGGAPNEYTARFMVAALALAAIGAAYLLGRDLFGRQVGLAAAVLAASVPILPHWAASGYTDLPAGTYYTLAALFAWRTFRRPHPAHALLAGLLAGLALLTKNGGLLLIGLLPAWIVYTHWAARWQADPAGHRDRPARHRADRRGPTAGRRAVVRPHPGRVWRGHPGHGLDRPGRSFPGRVVWPGPDAQPLHAGRGAGLRGPDRAELALVADPPGLRSAPGAADRFRRAVLAGVVVAGSATICASCCWPGRSSP